MIATDEFGLWVGGAPGSVASRGEQSFAMAHHWLLLDDEDEFSEHQISMGSPPDLIEATRAEADRLRVELSDLTDPFGAVSEGYLADVERSLT